MGRPIGRRTGQRIYTTCLQCRVSVPTSSNKRKYCSRKCFELSHRKPVKTSICEQCSSEFECLSLKPSGVRDLRIRRFCCRSCKMKYITRVRKPYVMTDEWRKKIGDAQRGENGNNWRGGVTPLNKKLRRTPEYVSWRKAVFERDDYTCQFCKVRGGELNADHIKPFSTYPELRHELSNGRTLCVPCHRTTDTYAKNAKYQ